MKPVRDTCKPRDEVLRGDLEDAIFAANFGHVVDGRAPAVYQQAAEFFRNTHPAAPLRKIVTAIFGRLADPKEAGAAIRLSTGFGGGKTHTLIALWHLAKNVTKASVGRELLPAAGRPVDVVVVGVDGVQAGTAVLARHDEIEIHSLWAELAFQLGGKPGLRKAKPVDNPEVVPDAALIRSLLPAGKPVLILIDEVVSYMAKLPSQGRAALREFMRVLTDEVQARPQTVLVVSDPGPQATYQQEAATLDEILALQEAIAALEDVLGRKMTDFEPIKGEEAQVINRRLFAKISQTAAEEASAEHLSAYQRISAEHPDALPAEAATMAYAKRIRECYPFHPRLLESAQDRLGALQDFHKSRGTLRLFARIVRDVWESRSDVPLICAGDLNWTSDRIQGDLLQRLQRDNFKPAVDADIVRHAGQLDSDYATDVHRRVASALLLESIPLTPSAAMDRRDLTLAVVRPSDAGHEPGEAMDRLYSVCWHTYRDESGRKFQFRFEPNVNRLIEERASDPALAEDARMQVLAMARQYFSGPIFRLVPFPTGAKAVPETQSLQLALSDSEQLAQAVCDYEDDSDPAAKRPRRFRNAILGIAPSPDGLNDAIHAVRLRMAAEAVAKEERRNRPLRDQVDELLPQLRKRAALRVKRAFNRVVFQGRRALTLEERYLVSEESALEEVHGQAKVKEFLDAHDLIYQPQDALDVDLLLEGIIPGATPSLDHKGAYPASAVHERALSHEKLRLMMDEGPVRRAILGAVEEGLLAVRLPNGEAFDERGCVSGPPGNRQRTEARRLTTLHLTSDVLVAPKSAPCIEEWLRVDDGERAEHLTYEDAAARKYTTVASVAEAVAEGSLDSESLDDQPMVVNNDRFRMWEPPAPRPSVVYTWEEAIEHASRRPLRSLQFTARTPEAAKSLFTLAQPLGARSLTLRVEASGGLKDGGTVNFLAADVKHNSPLKPVDVAGVLRRAMREDGTFEAALSLGFGDAGLQDAGAKLQQAQETAGEDVGLQAEFGAEE
jgi:hypothetical protein